MLRRKLLIHFGLVVALFVLTATAAIWLLGGVLFDVRHLDAQGQTLVQEINSLTLRFRNIVVILAVVFLLVINVSVIIVLRISSLIIKPVDQLIEATRELGHEHFDYRVRIEQNDEFQELASAYNKLAEDLQVSEGRKMEVLSQTAVMINHELNNAMAVIGLQLQRLGRDKSISPETTARLRDIEQSLQKMTKTVQALKNVRRIVLTDYVPGLKMLDLEKSTANEPEMVSSQK
jgi:nitrate/nitrite-specific signal transduction histidine kinase